MDVTKDKMKVSETYKIEVHENEEARLRGDAPIHEVIVHNKMTNASLAQITGLMSGLGGTVFTALAVGTSNTAVSASQTALQAELTTLGLSRHAATVTQTTTAQTNDTLSFTYTWSVTGSTTVNEIGIFNNNSSGGTMLSRALTGAVAVVNTNQLTATYTWQAAGN